MPEVAKNNLNFSPRTLTELGSREINSRMAIGDRLLAEREHLLLGGEQSLWLQGDPVEFSAEEFRGLCSERVFEIPPLLKRLSIFWRSFQTPTRSSEW
jgi:hypothetical protein